jgi:alkylated DNA repair protein (DNA oxidative demethylase)
VTAELRSFGIYHWTGGAFARQVPVLADEACAIAAAAPLARPTMRDGTGFKVQVTSAGEVGWWADAQGYRYVDRHPVTGRPWPPISDRLRRIARSALDASITRITARKVAESYDTCLLNFYDAEASLGWHDDRTEADQSTPIVCLSIGATALFEIRIGDRTHGFELGNGDALVLAGQARRAPHRIAEIYPHALWDDRPPIADGTRLSFTFRRARALEGS